MVKGKMHKPMISIGLKSHVAESLGRNSLSNVVEALVYCLYFMKINSMVKMACALSDTICWHILVCDWNLLSDNLSISSYYTFKTQTHIERFNFLFALLKDCQSFK